MIDREQFTRLLRYSGEGAMPVSTDLLAQLVKVYPYCALFHLRLAQATGKAAHISKAALHVPDRARLKQVINREFHVTDEELATLSIDFSAEEVNLFDKISVMHSPEILEQAVVEEPPEVSAVANSDTNIPFVSVETTSNAGTEEQPAETLFPEATAVEQPIAADESAEETFSELLDWQTEHVLIDESKHEQSENQLFEPTLPSLEYEPSAYENDEILPPLSEEDETTDTDDDLVLNGLDEIVSPVGIASFAAPTEATARPEFAEPVLESYSERLDAEKAYYAGEGMPRTWEEIHTPDWQQLSDADEEAFRRREQAEQAWNRAWNKPATDEGEITVLGEPSDESTLVTSYAERLQAEAQWYAEQMKTVEATPRENTAEFVPSENKPTEQPLTDNLSFFDSLAEESAAAVQPQNAPAMPNQNMWEIIDEFIRKEPTIRIDPNKAETETQQEDLSDKSVQENQDNISEYLARIYLRQGKKEKAIDIYRRLALKYPQKSAYFAAQIEELNRL